jgi:hypothetical protein
MRISARRRAGIAVFILFLALVRSLAEIYRLRAVRGPGFALADALPYVTGAMIAAVGGWAAVGSFMWQRYGLAIAAASVTILVMLTYKVAVLGW